MELRLDLRLTQKLVMTPQLQQAIKLLQLSRLELQQVLSQHLLENPLLEEISPDLDETEDTPNETFSEKEEGTGESEGSEESTEGEATTFDEPLSPDGWDDYFEPDWQSGLNKAPLTDEEFPSYEQTLTKPTSLEDHLLWQLRLSSLDEHDKALGAMVIGNLDEDGYLRTPLQEIAQDAKVPLEKMEAILGHIQTFDPPGVGARSLVECLLIQLKHLQQDPIGETVMSGSAEQQALAETLIQKYLPELQKKRYATVAKELGVSLDEVCQAVHVIEGLEPKPGRPYFSEESQIIVPDVYVFKNEGEWVVMLNEDGLPRVRINPYYKRLMSHDEDGGTTRAYLEEKMRAAQWILRSIDQRNKTILKVVKSLVKFQEPFLEKGIQYLKPLVLRQVAEDVGMHESTISRVTTNKYMYCPQGMLELKFFFNAGIQRAEPGAEELSSLTVREMIREMVSQENPARPLKDQEIVLRLRNRGIVIARRTVAKYRAELNIAPASQRKRIPSA
ncbi:MAG: RNA polymerase sigma-54 factor [Nitrospirae bacterium]|nr:MAG: RNA polymerase sigma-54 factor [Nitrospirota bacterium]